MTRNVRSLFCEVADEPENLVQRFEYLKVKNKQRMVLNFFRPLVAYVTRIKASNKDQV